VNRTVTLFLALSSALSIGCAPTVTTGARALLPQQTADANNVWVYLDVNDDEKSGVYRCRDVGEQVVCVKAKLVTK